MKVNLLPGTSTPTLTPMPGVHKALHRTAILLRSIAAGELGRWYDLHCNRLCQEPVCLAQSVRKSADLL